MIAIVMYHYVRDVERTAFPGIKALAVDDFKKQIDYLKKRYEIVTLGEYVLRGAEQRDAGQRLACLTFDDGFRDHYTNVYPILRDSGLRASFFPISGTMLHGFVADVHKVHFLLDKLGSAELAERINSHIENHVHDPGVAPIRGKSIPPDSYRWDDPLTAEIKIAISRMQPEYRGALLTRLFHRVFPDEDTFSKELYMSENEIQEMISYGMEFGGHTYSHPSLDSLGAAEQLEEISADVNFFRDRFDLEMKTFCYPYGGYNDVTVSILRKSGITAAVTVNAGFNFGDEDPLQLKRIDTNELEVSPE